jgi:hypothetical protein
VKTVNIDRYIHLHNKLIPALHWCGVGIADIYFQQDWAIPHLLGHVLDDYRKHSVIIWFRSRWTVETKSPQKDHWTFFDWESWMTECKYNKANHYGDLKLAMHHGIWKVNPNKPYSGLISQSTKNRVFFSLGN